MIKIDKFYHFLIQNSLNEQIREELIPLWEGNNSAKGKNIWELLESEK